MARTRLFRAVQQAVAAAGGPSGPRALSRRQVLKMAAASAALAGCAPLTGFGGGSIAIVGGGVAGLTIAYRLALAGRPVTLHEASNRFGGRMFTRRNFNAEGMFCELGGELVDSNHAPLMVLARELGVGIQKLKPDNDPGEDIYFIGGALHSEREMLRRGHGAFATVANRIARDQLALVGADGSWTARAVELDAISVKAYLDKLRGSAPEWVIDLLDLAYWGEFGLPTDQQSALNLIDLIGTEAYGNFEIFGESDEAYRIEGGSSSLTDALLARLGPQVRGRSGHALKAIAAEGSGVRLQFEGPRGETSAWYNLVALALPFTKLREVAGLDTLGLDGAKLQAIRELGYGDNAKIMVGTADRPWTSTAAGLPVLSSGEFYSDTFQVAWDTSRGQPGTRGILTNYLTATEDQGEALARLERGLRQISPAIAGSLDMDNIASFFWARHPFAKGSFSAPKVGQYTRLLDVAGTPELGGRIQFAGEHTSSDYLGYMCGAVESGERVARAILALV